ncbi:ABC transporter substrate-binding protein [Nocardioides sp. Kera G14]|uniref:taurine ABC transporter substrate-binding protein n=1 Tax=Nocardioides sp. Kera G14 TaxID=2884264 RepID=UPI001D10923D|nr:ABC transporter substrate-binding protein [Nocardioides sp. Kera G14]UDY23024.1 ABC transporter substrate-binding protein [Nocardioides sp. Kera G14]
MTRTSTLVRLVAAGVLATTTLGLSACGGSDDSDSTASGQPKVIRIGYQLITNGDLVVKNQKLLERAFGDDVKIEWKQFASGGDVNTAIAAGSLDIGLAGSSPVSRGLSTNLPYEVPWIFDVIGDAEALAAKPGITSIADLKGKTVATPFASTSHYSLLAALKNAGVDVSSVKIIDAEPDAILASWKAGKIDAAYVWNPTLAQLDGATTLVTSAELAAKGQTTYDLAVVATAFAKKYPDAVQTWVKAEDEAVKQLNAGDQKAYDSIAAEANITPEDAEEQAKGLIFVDAADQAGDDYLGKTLPDNLYAAAQFNKDLGQIDSVADEQSYHDAVVPTFAAAVK